MVYITVPELKDDLFHFLYPESRPGHLIFLIQHFHHRFKLLLSDCRMYFLQKYPQFLVVLLLELLNEAVDNFDIRFHKTTVREELFQIDAVH